MKQDEYGLSVQAGGHTARPAFPSRYKVGDDVKTHHYSGSINVGVGKDGHSCRGKYVELWFVEPSNKPFGKTPSHQEVADDIAYHKAKFLQSKIFVDIPT